MATPDEPWTVGRLLSWTVEYLTKHGAENPRLDAEVLLAEARGCRRIELYAAYTEPADERTRTAFRELVRRRAAGTPVAYLVGRREFYSLEFEVTPDVLIPRPETEHVVVALLDEVKLRAQADRPLGAAAAAQSSFSEPAPNQRVEQGRASASDPGPSPRSPAPLSIADVGTGSGILAVCAAKYVPEARVTAIDISPAALQVARRNAERHGVAERIEFVVGDLFANVPSERRFDYIVSNPPYVSTAEMDELAPDVSEHEPRQALHAGEQGTDVIVPLVEQAAQRLKPSGSLFIEISPMISERVERLLQDAGKFDLRPTIRDLAGHPRVVHARMR